MNALLARPSIFKPWGQDGFSYFPEAGKSGHHNFTRTELLSVLRSASPTHRTIADYGSSHSRYNLAPSSGMRAMSDPDLTWEEKARMIGIADAHGSGAFARFTHGQWYLTIDRGRIRLVYTD